MLVSCRSDVSISTSGGIFLYLPSKASASGEADKSARVSSSRSMRVSGRKAVLLHSGISQARWSQINAACKFQALPDEKLVVNQRAFATEQRPSTRDRMQPPPHFCQRQPSAFSAPSVGSGVFQVAGVTRGFYFSARARISVSTYDPVPEGQHWQM